MAGDALGKDALFEGLGRVLDLAARGDHPGFFAFIPGQPTWPGALADFAAAALNANAINGIGSPGPSQVELTVADWIRGWGYPEGAGGVVPNLARDIPVLGQRLRAAARARMSAS